MRREKTITINQLKLNYLSYLGDLTRKHKFVLVNERFSRAGAKPK